MKYEISKHWRKPHHKQCLICGNFGVFTRCSDYAVKMGSSTLMGCVANHPMRVTFLDGWNFSSRKCKDYVEKVLGKLEGGAKK